MLVDCQGMLVCFRVQESAYTCVVHTVGKVVSQCAVGEKLFENITAASALNKLREMLTRLGVAEACCYRTHDLRRGHAKDLQLSGDFDIELKCFHVLVLRGAPLREILMMGE